VNEAWTTKVNSILIQVVIKGMPNGGRIVRTIIVEQAE
jgi:hypothetical protein